jgi:hypothetical protein
MPCRDSRQRRGCAAVAACGVCNQHRQRGFSARHDRCPVQKKQSSCVTGFPLAKLQPAEPVSEMCLCVENASKRGSLVRALQGARRQSFCGGLASLQPGRCGLQVVVSSLQVNRSGAAACLESDPFIRDECEAAGLHVLLEPSASRGPHHLHRRAVGLQERA